MGHSVVMTVAGVDLPHGMGLNLGGAVLVQNPITLAQGDAPAIGPNATLFRQPRRPDGRLREAARYLLGFELPDEFQLNTDTISAVAEITVLPLRLLTSASITLGLAEVSRRPLEDMLSQGCESIAAMVQPVQEVVTLAESDCTTIESYLPSLQLPDQADWLGIAWRLTEAYYKPNSVEQGLAFLVALENLVAPSSKKGTPQPQQFGRFPSLHWAIDRDWCLPFVNPSTFARRVVAPCLSTRRRRRPLT